MMRLTFITTNILNTLKGVIMLLSDNVTYLFLKILPVAHTKMEDTEVKRFKLHVICWRYKVPLECMIWFDLS